MTPETAEATIRSETRTLATGLTHYTSAVVMDPQNPRRRRCLLEAVHDFKQAIARISAALAAETPAVPIEGIPVHVVGDEAK